MLKKNKGYLRTAQRYLGEWRPFTHSVCPGLDIITECPPPYEQARLRNCIYNNIAQAFGNDAAQMNQLIQFLKEFNVFDHM